MWRLVRGDREDWRNGMDQPHTPRVNARQLARARYDAGARRAILNMEMISAIVVGCSEAIILARTPDSLVARDTATIAAAVSSAAM